MRAGTGKNESSAGREPETGNDGLHPVDGGSSGSVSRGSTHAQDIADWPAVSGQDGPGAASVQATPWFEPIEDNGCKDGVCPVPWATKPYRPELQPDLVNHPPHYTDGGIECIEAIEAQSTIEEYRGYLRSCCVKYLWRYRLKGQPLQDLEKCQWYLSRLAKTFED